LVKAKDCATFRLHRQVFLRSTV